MKFAAVTLDDWVSTISAKSAGPRPKTSMNCYLIIV